MKITTVGPVGALLCLANLDTELYGVRHKKVRSGKIVSNHIGKGETSKSIFYIDGKRVARYKAEMRISEFVKFGDIVEIEGERSF